MKCSILGFSVLPICLALSVTAPSANGDDSLLTSAAEEYKKSILPLIDPSRRAERAKKMQADFDAKIKHWEEYVASHERKKNDPKEVERLSADVKESFLKGEQYEIDATKREIAKALAEWDSDKASQEYEKVWRQRADNAKELMAGHLNYLYARLMSQDIRSGFQGLDNRILNVSHQMKVLQMAYDKTYLGKYIQAKLETVMGSEEFCRVVKGCPERSQVKLDSSFNAEFKRHSQPSGGSHAEDPRNR
ncbi:MAG: hypothetical protein HYR96_12665 [Deltaproteobacteria bacterium]|nr:hypothetical protein [Deltaproteobacteria bacterium]MBI3294222.1 hypothetical protein [Deltaproteobacteria bacterium]